MPKSLRDDTHEATRSHGARLSPQPRRTRVRSTRNVKCGTFGVICSSDQQVDRNLARSLALSLLRHSESRGREAAGIAVHDGEKIQVLKQSGSVSDFLKNRKLHELLDRGL